MPSTGVKQDRLQNRRRRLLGRTLADKDTRYYINDLRWSILISACFLLLGIMGITRHEMWRDEYQAWMIAHNSSSLSDLFRISRFDGHPATWYAVLFLISRLTSNSFWMQALHLSIATLMVYTFNRFSRFGRFIKFLFTFGYYPLFEYALISREYALGFFCVIILCALYGRRQERYLQLSLILLLLSNASVYGLLLALSFAAILFLDYLVFAKKSSRAPASRTRLAFSILFVICGPILLWFQLRPGEEHYFPLQWAAGFEWERFKIVVTFVLRSYFPLPDLRIVNFWNSHFLLSGFSDSRPLLSLLIVLASAFLFIRKPLVLLFYSGGTFGILTLSYLTGLPWLRHIGHMYLLFIASAWIAHYYDPQEIPWKPLRTIAGPYLEKFGAAYLVLILFVNFLSGVYAFQMDLIHPFSNSRAAARYIMDNRLDRFPIMGSADYIVSPLSSLLDKRIFYPERGEEGSFILWDKQRKDVLGLTQIGVDLAEMMQRGNDRVLVVLDSGIYAENDRKVLVKTGNIAPDIQITFQEKFDDECIVGDEKYYLYIAQKQGMH